VPTDPTPAVDLNYSQPRVNLPTGLFLFTPESDGSIALLQQAPTSQPSADAFVGIFALTSDSDGSFKLLPHKSSSEANIDKLYSLSTYLDGSMKLTPYGTARKLSIDQISTAPEPASGGRSSAEIPVNGISDAVEISQAVPPTTTHVSEISLKDDSAPEVASTIAVSEMLVENEPLPQALSTYEALNGEVLQNHARNDAILENKGPARIAVIVKFSLGSSQYATMALRELMKAGGVKTYIPEFTSGN
jgi:hypothetical protein